MSPTNRILSVTYSHTIYTGIWMSLTFRILSIFYESRLCKAPESTTYNITGVWVRLYFHSLYRRLSVTLFPILQKGVRRQCHENVTITLIPWILCWVFFQRISAGPRYVRVRWKRWEIHLAYPMKCYYFFSASRWKVGTSLKMVRLP